jgi:hypothetical protein
MCSFAFVVVAELDRRARIDWEKLTTRLDQRQPTQVLTIEKQ